MSQAYDEEFLEEYLKEDVAVPTSNGSNKVTVYKVKQSGFKTEKYVRESGDWIKSDEAGKSKSRQFTTGAARGLAVGIAGAANKMLLNEGIGASAGVAVSAEKADCDVHVAKLAGVKILDAGAEAKVGNASVGASATPIQAEAFAKASGAEASAHADLVKGVFGADARAVAGEAKAKAGFGLKDLGAHAGQKNTFLLICYVIHNPYGILYSHNFFVFYRSFSDSC